MSFDAISTLAEKLSYRDKFRLAQLLIQQARKEEEEHAPTDRRILQPSGKESVQYVGERLLKLKPAKLTSLRNSIAAMYQFQGGISEDDLNGIIAALKKLRRIVVSKDGRVTYPNTK